MSSPYKLLILDADGTSVPPERESLPTQAVVKAVREAQKLVHVALGTGRSYQSSRKIIKALGLQGPSVLSGGAVIVD
ncbi:MAG TPA: HAD hydrolase family protein, partial [Candidatus Polarisedimenticolaceae bacterium]|nr:HAD hydrolase family protein [Candidatus Polarisedimenticolaceae bacterium]